MMALGTIALSGILAAQAQPRLGCCEIEWGTVNWQKGIEPGRTGFRIDYVVKFKTGGNFKPSCCEFQQKTYDSWSVWSASGSYQSGGTPERDDNYSANDDMNPRDDYFVTNDNTGLAGLNPNDGIYYKFRAKQLILDKCRGLRVVAQTDWHTAEIGGKEPRGYVGIPYSTMFK